MQFTNLVLAAAAFATSVSAKVMFTDPTFAGIAVGQSFNLTWTGAAAAVTITLQNGPPSALKDVTTITTGGGFPSGSFAWTPSSDLPADTYAIKISDGTDENFSTQFQLVGATASASGTSASSTSGSSTGSSSATSATTGSTSSAASTSTTASSTISSSANSTTTKTSSSSSSKTSSAASSSSTTSAPGGNSASGLASPFAIVLLAFAGAVLSLN